MTWAVILVAWLATLPQLTPQQQSRFFISAITTILPAVTLLLEGGFPAAQLGACLALVHAQGHLRLGSKARGFWSTHWLSVG